MTSVVHKANFGAPAGRSYRRQTELVRGGLELKGARHTVEVPLEVRLDGARLLATGEVRLRLRRLGVEPPSVAGVARVPTEALSES